MPVPRRSLAAVLAATAGAVGLGLSPPMTWAVTTALFMGGTGHPLGPPDTTEFVAQYMGTAVTNFVGPASTAVPATGVPGPGGSGYNEVAVITPEEFLVDPGPLTYDQSVAAGRSDLDGCIQGTACTYNVSASTGAAAIKPASVNTGRSVSACCRHDFTLAAGGRPAGPGSVGGRPVGGRAKG